jgi:filamentous hemagglutinin family protein
MKNKSTASLSLRKVILSALVAAPLATLPSPLWALPSSQANLNNQVVSTTAGVTVTLTNANRVDVTSSATNSVVKWANFGDTSGNNQIDAGQTVAFTLPSSSSGILNMVTGSTATTVNGTISSNGNVFILNPNGVTVGATGVITANGVGLSTIPETEYTFLTTGNLGYVENQNVATSQPVTVTSGATITAASGTGNVYIAGKGAALNGTIDAGNVWVKSVQGGAVSLASTGSLTIGDSATYAGNITVTTDTGAITVGTGANNVIVLGPSASLTAGNNTISQGTGYLQIGNGTANGSLTVNAGTSSVTLGDARANGSKTLSVNATGKAGVSVTDKSGDLAIGASVTGGNLVAATTGGNITLNASTVSGTVGVTAVAGDIWSGGSVTAASGAATGAVTLTADNGKNITYAGRASGYTFTAATGTLGNVSLTSTDTLTTPTITAGNITLVAAKDITGAGTQTATGTLSITSTTGAVTLGETIVTKDLSVTTSAAKDIDMTGSTVTLTGNATFTSGGNLTLAAIAPAALTANATGNASLTGAVTATTANITAGGDVSTSAAFTGTTTTVTAGGNITIGAAFGATTGTLNAGGAIAYNGTVTVPTLSAKSATMTETGTIISATKATLDASTSATLNGNNDFATLVLKNGTSGLAVSDINGVVLGDGTNATGNVTITASKTTAGAVAFGAAAADVLTFKGDLTVDNTTTVNANVTDASNNINVLGKLNVSTAGTGTITLSGATGNGVGLANTFGQVNLTTANQNATVFEQTTLNLGTINLGTGNLGAYSSTSIVNTGKLTVNNVSVGAGTAAAPGDISLNFDDATTPVHNAIAGTVTIKSDIGLLGSSSVGNYLVNNLSITNGVNNAALVDIPANIYGSGIAGNITLTGVGTANIGASALNTTGGVWLTSNTGTITATNAGNTFTWVSVNSGDTAGASAISTTKDLTVNATLKGTATGAFTFTSAGNITLAAISSGDTAATTFTATKGIWDSQTGISIYGDVNFTGSSINITKAGHNFGKIAVTTTGNGAATIVESGTSKYAAVSTGSGDFTATSTNGDILQTAGITTTGNVTLSAANGAVTASNAGNSIAGWIGLTAKNDSALTNTVNTVLGNLVVTSGGLTAVSGANTIAQATGATIYTYGATSFTATNKAISLGNTGNQFGGVTLNSGTADSTIKEWTTLNLKSVTAANLTATSENGSIVDSGAGAITPSGTATFSAPHGSVTLALAGSDYGTVVFSNVAGSASIKDANSITVGNATVTGDLSVTAGAAGAITQTGTLAVGGNATYSAGTTVAIADGSVTGNLTATAGAASALTQTGTLTVGGNATYTAGTNITLAGETIGGALKATAGSAGTIGQSSSSPLVVSGNVTLSGQTVTLTNTGNQFGAVKLNVTAASIIDETTTFNLAAGSSASAAVTINTLGNFVTSGSGGSTFTNNLTINASGTIIPSANSLFISGTFTVNSPSKKDLSALSQSANLGGNTPVNQGTGVYVPPGS